MQKPKYHSLPQAQVTAEQISLSDIQFNDQNAPRSTTSTHRRDSKSIPGIFTIWAFEIILLVVMAISLVAMVITARVYQSKPVPKWPHKISVNTLNAIYGAVLKATMLVAISAGLSQLKWSWFKMSRPLKDIEHWDQASRGPWGSLLLIWHLRGRHIVATTGALIMILALALDPFIQLLVFYDNCDTVVTGQMAILPRRNTFNETGAFNSAADYLSEVSPRLANAATAGILGAAVSNVTATCQTGNCTFDDSYHSIAFCSDCRDITDNVSIRCAIETQYSTTSNYSYDEQICNVSVPGGYANIVANDGGSWSVLKFSVQASVTNDSSWVVIANNLTQSGSPACTNDSWACRGYGAANCSLRPCVQTYQARVENGLLNETRLDTSDGLLLYNKEEEIYGAIDVKCLSSDTRDKLVQLHYPINDATKWVDYRGTTYYYDTAMNDYNKSGINVNLPSKCIYGMDKPTGGTTREYLSTILVGNVSIAKAAAFVGPLVPKRLFNAGNVSFDSISSAFDSMATAMTVYLRQAPISNFTASSLVAARENPALGTTSRTETCMHVHWPYIAYPAGLVLLTLIFFVGMVFETYTHSRDCDWKDSSLALVFHGLLDKPVQAAALRGISTDTKKDMDRVASRVYVTFDAND